MCVKLVVLVCVCNRMHSLQQLLSQQKDSDQEENRKLSSEREAQLKRIQQLSEEMARLKAELAR